MGAVERSPELALALRTTSRDQWADSSGIRGVIRHGFARQGGLVLLGAGLGGLLLGSGHPGVFSLLTAAAAAQLVVPELLTRIGRPPSTELEFRVAVASWPLALLLLAAAGWSGDHDLGEIVAVVGFFIGALVALAEARVVALVWTVIAAAAVAIGAGLAGPLDEQTALAIGAICGGTITGDRLRELLETFLGARRRLLRDVARVPIDPDPFVTADLLLIPLVRWTPLKTPSIIWFRDDGQAVFLATAGDNVPPTLGAHKPVPPERNRTLREQAMHGPWISGWTVRHDDAGYSRAIAGLGIQAVAYVPLVYEQRVLGVVAAGLTDRADDRSTMAEYVPTLVQFADAAAVELGPILAEKERHSAANILVDDILTRSAFWPVFQPVQRLSDGRVVGFEALTRFGVPESTADVFATARLTDRSHELELVTLRAAAEASARLPADAWISVNVSAGTLIETEALAAVLDPIGQPIVIELSEQDAVRDYGPIADALAALGPRCRLAVDDAGSGFASLRHILEVKPTFVKLDIGLVKNVATDLTRTALVAGFVRFAADAGFELIAEGIETEADHQALRRLGVGLGQGYLLGRPARIEDLVGAATTPS